MRAFERMLTPGRGACFVGGRRGAGDGRHAWCGRTAEDAWSLESLFETVIDPLVNGRAAARIHFLTTDRTDR